MDGIELLKRDALIRRNAKILAAKREYHAALKEIGTLKRTLGIRPPGRPRKVATAENPCLKASVVARAILLEGKPLTPVELTLEVQRRGCRSLDDPRAVAKAIREGLRYWPQFKRDRAGRWAVIER